MPSLTEVQKTLIAVAAELRASGETWEMIADKVQRSASRLARWPREYPDEWAAAFRAAEARLVADAGAEALFMLRKLLRSYDEKSSFRAAELLFKSRQSERNEERHTLAPANRRAALIEAMRELSDADFAAALQLLLADRALTTRSVALHGATPLTERALPARDEQSHASTMESLQMNVDNAARCSPHQLTENGPHMSDLREGHRAKVEQLLESEKKD